eukprot:1693744-Amphidinium_carterae.1
MEKSEETWEMIQCAHAQKEHSAVATDLLCHSCMWVGNVPCRSTAFFVGFMLTLLLVHHSICLRTSADPVGLSCTALQETFWDTFLGAEKTSSLWAGCEMRARTHGLLRPGKAESLDGGDAARWWHACHLSATYYDIHTE